MDEAVALAHLAGAGGHQVDGAPPGVGDQVNAVGDGLAHGLDVALQIGDAVRIVDGAVLFDLVVGAHAVLDHHQRNLVTGVNLVEGDAQAQRVDLPTPVGGLQVGVLAAKGHVALGHLVVLVGTHGAGHVVAKGVEVDLAVGDILQVAVLHRELDAVLGPEALGVERVLAAHLHVGAVPVHGVHLLLRGEHVDRIARGGVGEDEAIHVAHLELRVVLVSVAHDAAAGHELVMQGLEALLSGGLDGARRALEALDQAGLHHGAHVHGAAVDLVEGEPELNLVLVAVKDGLAVLLEEADELAACPAVVLLDQVIGHLVVREGHERLDVVSAQAVENAVVEGETGLVGLGVVAVGEDTAPRDGHAEHVEAHLGEQRNVLLVVMVEIDAVMVGIEAVGVDIDRDLARLLVAAAQEVVVDGSAAAVHVPSALKLVGGGGATPIETLGELDVCHEHLLCIVGR